MTTTTTLLGGKEIHRMGLGAMQLAGPGVFGPPSDPGTARTVLRRAIELGVDHIDTSQYYGPDVVNDLIREALYPYPDELKLATKVGWRRDEAGGILPAQRPYELREGVEANLRSLRVDRLDLVYLRLISPEQAVALEDQLGELEDLHREGKLDLIGVSNVDQATLERALGQVDVASVQNAYNVLERDDDNLVAFARQHEIAFVPWALLGSSFRGPARLGAERSIAEVADNHHATPTQIALAWLLARYERMLLIPGTSSVAHLEQNVAALQLELSDTDLATLDHVGRRIRLTPCPAGSHGDAPARG